MASSNSNRYKMSQERLDELMKELNYMETVREKEVSEQIKEARSFGDLRTVSTMKPRPNRASSTHGLRNTRT